MWLCTIGWDNLTNQRTDLASHHLKCCFGHSEMPEQILSSKKVCIPDCIPKQQKSTPENNDHIYCVLSARSEVQVIHKWKLLIKWLLLGRKDGRCIYIALYCVSLHTQSASQSCGGGLSSTTTSVQHPQDNGASALTTPLLFTRSAMGFLMTTESQNLGLTSHPKYSTFWQ